MADQGMRHRARQWLAALVTAGLLVAQAPATAVAYDGVAAAAYADAHWAECGPSPYNHAVPSPYVCMANDCANLASRVMKAGGYRFTEGSNENPLDAWYWYNSSMKTPSWYQAARLYQFLIYYDKGAGSHGGATLKKEFVGVTAAQKYNTLTKGDLIFMDLDNTGGIDHVRVETGYGTPSKIGYQSAYNGSYWTTGDWATQHNVPRYHDFWNGFYQMTPADQARAHIYEVDIPNTSG